MSEINSFVFINIGTIRDRPGFVPITLCTKILNKNELLEYGIDVSEDFEDEVLFDFESVKDQYIAGQSLDEYDLRFSKSDLMDLEQFLSSIPQPVALVSCCGNKQFPMLRNALEGTKILSQKLRCIDIWPLFAVHLGMRNKIDDVDISPFFRFNEEFPIKFPAVYERITGNEYNEDPNLQTLMNLRMLVKMCEEYLPDEFQQWAKMFNMCINDFPVKPIYYSSRVK